MRLATTVRLVSALAVLLWMAPAASWMPPTAGATECTSRTECPGRAERPLHVPGEFRSVQEAIDAAPDGATILMAAGVYHESFRVAGKRLRIMGADDGRTEISAPGRNIKLATYASDGGGELKRDNLGSPNETLHACQDLTLDLQPLGPDDP